MKIYRYIKKKLLSNNMPCDMKHIKNGHAFNVVLGNVLLLVT